MSAVPLDPVDLSWRILGNSEKPLTPRGRSRISARRRTRGHEELEKHDGSPKHSGRRFVALAKATTRDVVDGLVDFFDSQVEEDDCPARMVIGYSNNARRWERRRRKADARDIRERHQDILRAIESELRESARRLDPLDLCDRLEEHIAWLETELKRASTSSKAAVLNFRLQETRLELELARIDLQVLAPYMSVA